MKKLLSVLLLSTLLILVFTSCKITFDGYSYNIDDARKQEASYYEEYDYIFSIEDDGNYVDFLVCGGQLRIVKFDTKEQSNTTLYKIKSKATFLIDEALASTDSETAWTKTGNFPFQIEWRIIEKDIDSVEGFEFAYNNTICLLQYRIYQSE